MSSKSSQSKFTQKRKKLSPFTRDRIIAQHESNRNAQEIDIYWMHRLMATSRYDNDSPFVNLAKPHLLVPTSFSGCLQNFAFKSGCNRAVDCGSCLPQSPLPPLRPRMWL
ncbi:unnamed protein product [Rhizopus microsporus]|nr:hypothetical protein G6F71_009228 [Rhizopus microsporus]KAG1205231.1 hypothetical protein G6F69_009477 [Rhizopus microsporus]KAG1224222.1 hypothetical protein G6F67_009544 [Rhizopus microsporus]KAG1256980.1 hypothetical protein G6F68_009525 [Rhizopus microsporus]